MKLPLFYVDFNEMTDVNVVLLSASDQKTDSKGRSVNLRAGMHVRLFMDDINEKGKVDNLVAVGVVERNVSSGWGKHVKWCCRIDEKGIRTESEVR